MVRSAIGVFALSAASGLAVAGTVRLESLPGSSGLGSFEGSLSFVAGSGRSGVLRLTISNTSPTSLGGFITGVSFVAPSGVQLTGLSGFDQFDLVPLPPSGSLRESNLPRISWGIVVGNGVLGRDPSRGVAAGGSATFEMSVAPLANGSLGDVSVESFVATLGGEPGFVVTMRGFTGGGADKVPAAWLRGPDDEGDPTGGSGGQPSAVPLPGAALAGAVGMAGLMMRRRPTA